ncbi:MAG TPA: PA14 domain-containing protein [Planctomycetota bacterium]
MALLLFCLPYVEAIYPLQQVLNESEVIAEGVIDKVDATNHVAFMKVTRSLKGSCAYAVIRMNFSGGQAFHPDAIRKHLVVGAPALIFYNAGRQAEVYLNRFFFQLYGDAGAPPEKAWWTFTHIEIRMNRTFVGPAPELADLVGRVLAGKAKAPEPNAKIPPMDAATLKALPAPLEAVADEAALPAPFARGALKPRAPENPASTSAGLAFDYYEGQWTSLPDFKALKPVKSGATAEFSNVHRGRETHFGLRFSGYLDVPREGVYTFRTLSNDGSKLYIGNLEVVNNDHHHGAVEMAGQIALKPGKHAIALTYFQEGGNTVLEVYWEGPELPRQKIPPAALFR